MEERTAARGKDASGGPSAPGGRYPPEAPAEGRRGTGRRGAPEGTRTSSLHPTYLRSAQSKMLLRKRGGRASSWPRMARQCWRGRGRSCGQGWRKKMIGGIPHYGSHRPNDVARSSRRGWQQIGWAAARRRCCRPVWSSTSSRACPRPRRTLEAQQLDDGLARGPDSSSGPPVKFIARGGQAVVGWGR